MILKIKIYLITAVIFSMPDLEANLSQVNLPLSLISLNLYGSQDPDNFYVFSKGLFEIRFSKDTTKHIFILPYLTKGNQSKYSAGLASAIGGSMAIVYAVDFYDRDLQVTAHEIYHTLGAKHNELPCNVMNSQPCSHLLHNQSKKEIYRQQFIKGNISKRQYVTRMKLLRVKQ